MILDIVHVRLWETWFIILMRIVISIVIIVFNKAGFNHLGGMPWHLFDEWGRAASIHSSEEYPGCRILKVKPVQTKMNGCIMHTFTGSS